MKQLSTTALAKKRNIETKELFKILSNKKWIYKKDEKWRLKKTISIKTIIRTMVAHDTTHQTL